MGLLSTVFQGSSQLAPLAASCRRHPRACAAGGNPCEHMTEAWAPISVEEQLQARLADALLISAECAWQHDCEALRLGFKSLLNSTSRLVDTAVRAEAARNPQEQVTLKKITKALKRKRVPEIVKVAVTQTLPGEPGVMAGRETFRGVHGKTAKTHRWEREYVGEAVNATKRFFGNKQKSYVMVRPYDGTALGRPARDIYTHHCKIGPTRIVLPLQVRGVSCNHFCCQKIQEWFGFLGYTECFGR